MRFNFFAGMIAWLGMVNPLAAGLYYTGEKYNELPARWRGFLLDQRYLRSIAIKPPSKEKGNPARQRYEQEAAKLEKASKTKKLTVDETADLGAIYVRLGEFERALEVMRPAQRTNPSHFRLAANLGTAWQLYGDPVQAAACLAQAVRLAPGKLRKAEELQLKLVRLRAKQKGEPRGCDDLFGVKYVGTAGKYEPGRLAPEQQKFLPSNALASIQQLALWLPADARLLWQLAELAAAHGDVAMGAAMLDGCVTEFGLRDAELLAHRKALRTAADARKLAADKAEHDKHALPFKPRSSRPFLVKASTPSTIDPKGLNPLPWEVLAETTLDRKYRPTFAKYLQELDGKRVRMTGYMQPLGEDPDLSSFLVIENPVGCWYCEMPELPGIVLIELPMDKTLRPTRGVVTVTGKLTLNSKDPENFLYTISNAKVVVSE
jgi:hypothetical protein